MDRGLIAPHFGAGPSFALGVEEELLLVDRRTHRLAPVGPQLADVLVAARVGATPELFAALIELVTPVCANAEEAATALHGARAALAAAGGTALGAGLHPAGDFGDAELVAAGRYDLIGEQLAGVLRTPTAALQVHVAMPDCETAIRSFNRMRRHVPVLQALAASSPFWHGRDSGLASARSAVLRSYPRSEIPRAFLDYEDFASTAESLADAAGVPDYTFFWWELRPHPRLGTLEIRCMDAQPSLGAAAGLAALVHGLVKHEAEEGSDRFPSREALAESSFRAARAGLEGRLVDAAGRLVPARDLAVETLALARPHARDLGSERPLEEIERILAEGNAAHRQRAAHARSGMAGLLADLVNETWPGRGTRAADRPAGVRRVAATPGRVVARPEAG